MKKKYAMLFIYKTEISLFHSYCFKSSVFMKTHAYLHLNFINIFSALFLHKLCWLEKKVREELPVAI